MFAGYVKLFFGYWCLSSSFVDYCEVTSSWWIPSPVAFNRNPSFHDAHVGPAAPQSAHSSAETNDRTHGTSNNTYWQYHTVLDLTYSTWFNQYLTFKYLGAHKTMIRKWVGKNGGQILANWRFLIGFTVYMFTTLWIGGDPPVTWVSYLGHLRDSASFETPALLPGTSKMSSGAPSFLFRDITSAGLGHPIHQFLPRFLQHLQRPRRVVEFHCGHRFRWIRLDSQSDKLAIEGQQICGVQSCSAKMEGPHGSSQSMWYFFEKGSCWWHIWLCHVLLNFFEWFMGWYGYFFLFFLWKWWQ